LFKGAVQDRARGVFQGKILVERGAQQTDARQNHHALMLTEGAQIDAKPELEIYADDVQCAHGNTIGALDEEALFYMRQRGIPESQAKALLIEAFVTDVFDSMAHEGVRDWFNDQARTWLEQRAG
jgi:Fe-S cluster assembly protein SufD